MGTRREKQREEQIKIEEENIKKAKPSSEGCHERPLKGD
jgi:hypothetical protein